MLGRGKFPAVLEENHAQYDSTMLPQLQLIGHVPIHFGGNEHAPTDNRPTKRVREEEHIYMQQKLGMSLNNNIVQDEPGHVQILLNPNPVSTGLRLSCEKEDHSSSITSTSEKMKNALPNTVKMELDRQMEEFGQYIKLQEEIILKGIRELNQIHTISLLDVLEKRVNKKLQEKELEIDNINRKNKELEDRIKKVAMEAQMWHQRAKHNESIASVLKSNIQQLMAGQCREEGSGDSEIDDAVSSTSCPGNQEHQLMCRGCKGKRVSVLLLPCRHLCLCEDCEGFIDVCPVCWVMKTASVHVYM